MSEQVLVEMGAIIRRCRECGRLIRFKRDRPGGPVTNTLIGEDEARDLLRTLSLAGTSSGSFTREEGDRVEAEADTTG